MPSVPRYGQPRVERTPLPGVTFRTPSDTLTSAGGAMGDAITKAGDAAARLGTAVLQRERERKSQVLQLEVGQQLAQLDDIYLSSPDQGLLTKQGKEPMALRDRYLDEIDTQLSEISKRATSPEDQAFVRQATQQWRAQFVARANRHASHELTKYEFAAMHASLESAVNHAAIHAAGGPAGREVIHASSAEIARILTTHGPRFGMDPQSITNAIEKGQARLHDAVVDRLIEERQHAEAAAYWDEVKDTILDAEMRARIARKVEQNTTEQKAFRIVDQVLAELAPPEGDDEAPFATDAIEKAIRERLRDDPAVYSVAVREFRSRKAGIEDAREQRRDAQQLPMLEAILNGATATQIMRMPEWRHAGETVQLRIAELAEQAEARREARQARREARDYERRIVAQRLREVHEWATYAQLADPATLANKSYRDAVEDALALPPALADRLLTLHRQLTNATGPPAAVVLDQADITHALDVSGYHFAVRKPRNAWSRDELAMYGRLEAIGREEIDRAQRAAGGRTLSIEQKGTILRGVISAQVTVSPPFVGEWLSSLGFNTGTPMSAIAVPADDRARVYVPLAHIPTGDLTEAVAWFRQHVQVGQTFAGDDATLLKTFRPRFERAYGLRRLGAPSHVIASALRATPIPENWTEARGGASAAPVTPPAGDPFLASPGPPTPAAAAGLEAELATALADAGYPFAAQQPPSEWSEDERALYQRLETLALGQTRSRAETAKILRAALGVTVKVSTVFIGGLLGDTGTEMPAIAVPTEHRGRVYVPLARIPKTTLASMITFFRQHAESAPRFNLIRMQTPSGEPVHVDQLTDAGILEHYARLFERAYGLEVTGAPRDVIESVLLTNHVPEYWDEP